MIVKVKSAYADQRGLHRKGDLIDVIKFEPSRHILVEEKKVEKVEKKPAGKKPAAKAKKPAAKKASAKKKAE